MLIGFDDYKIYLENKVDDLDESKSMENIDQIAPVKQLEKRQHYAETTSPNTE